MFVDHSRPRAQDAELRIEYLDPVTLARGHVVIDSLSNPAYGGVRTQKELRPDLLMTLARQRTLRYHLAHVPMVGAQLALQYDHDARDFPEVLGRFLDSIRPFLESSMSLGPDANVQPDLLEQVLQQNRLPSRMHVLQNRQGWDGERWQRYQQIIAAPFEYGETVKDVQTAYSVAYAAYTAGTQLALREMSVAVLGAGPFGMRIARYLNRMGAKVVALGDTMAAVHNANGLRKEVLEADNLVEVDVTSAMYITGDEFVSLPVDIIIAASNEDTIAIENVGRLRCGMVVEAAPHSITADAETVLNARGIHVFPSFAATVGPVFLTDGILRSDVGTPADALAHLTRNVQTTAHEVVRLSTSLRISLREAGLRLAFHHRFEKHPLRRVSGRINTVIVDG